MIKDLNGNIQNHINIHLFIIIFLRHEVEIEIKESQKNLEILKKNFEVLNKKIRFLDKDLETFQQELEKVQQDKQQKLNAVRCVVVLKLNQLQHLTSENKTANIVDTLVFPKKSFSNLYKRVAELEEETLEQLKRHQRNIKHFTRMNTDCQFMRKQIISLQEKIVQNMKSKFGKVVNIIEIEEAMLKQTFGRDDLHDLEEVILKKIVHDLRLSAVDVKGIYLPQLSYWKQQIVDFQKQLTYTLRHSTSQRELLTLLLKEKTELTQTLIKQEKKKFYVSSVKGISKKYYEEIKKLEVTIAEQNDMLQELKEEIKMLKTKGMLLKPKKSQKYLEEEDTKIWDHFNLEEEEAEEEECQHKPFSTEIIIPTTYVPFSLLLSSSSKKIYSQNTILLNKINFLIQSNINSC